MSVIRKSGILVLFVVVLAIGVTLGVAGRDQLMAMVDHLKHPTAEANVATPATGATRLAKRERKVKYWWDPMYNPPYISDRPGKSPMGMDLLPVYEDEISAGQDVKIDPVVVQNMGVRVARVVEGPMHATVRTVSYLTEPEQNHIEINLRVSGWIVKLYADYDGKELAAGDPLFDLYSPDLQVAIDELIAARRGCDSVAADADPTVRQSAVSLYDAARRKLELLGLNADVVSGLAKLEKAPAAVTFKSPTAGHITEKAVIEGAAVKAGERLMVISNRQDMWLEVQVYEHQLPYVKIGTPVRAKLLALPDRVIEGKVSFMYPHIDPISRTARVRITVSNTNHDLHEGMYATAEIDIQIAQRTLMVPREAVLDSGVRQIVFVAEAEGHFSPRKVVVGEPGNDGMLQIISGLAPGETVVTSGQFLMDSESRMKEAIEKHLNEHLLAADTQNDATAITTTAPATPVEAMPMASSKAADAVFIAYLDLVKGLGKVQTGTNPADASTLQAAGKTFIGGATDPDFKALGQSVVHAVSKLKGEEIDQQRKDIIALGDAVIALADRTPPSTAIAEKVYVIKCPMTGGSWLQIDDNIANPFFGSPTMKTCGGVVRTIPAGVIK